MEFDDLDEDVITERKQHLDSPKQWQVIILNDDYTPMNVVVEILQTHFNKTEGQSSVIMSEAHVKGSAQVGVYPKDIAETKVHHAVDDARKQGDYPLMLKVIPI